MSFNDLEDENNDTYADLQNNIFTPGSDIINYESSSFKFNVTTSTSLIVNNILYFNNFTTKFFKELLQELYKILSNAIFIYDNEYIEQKLRGFIDNFLFEYDLDPKNVLEIMTINYQNFSSLIGFFYQHGIGCKADKIKALEIYSESAENNLKEVSKYFSSDQKYEGFTFCDDDIKKLNRIILQYFYSLFLYKDIILYRKKNYKLNIKNAEEGDPVSQYYIGNYYHSKKDYKEAMEWYSKSAEGGNIRGMYMVGCCYHDGFSDIKDMKKAFYLFLKSVERGYIYSHALYKVGFCYELGSGVLKDESKAFEWYLKAAEKGDRNSQRIVAKYYNDGNIVSKNEEKGFYWNRKAAMNNDIFAQIELPKYYLNNSANKNERKAFNWYLKLANKDLSKALYFVAKCYRDGIGTDKNLDEATKWFKKFITLTYLKEVSLNDFLNGLNIHIDDY